MVRCLLLLIALALLTFTAGDAAAFLAVPFADLLIEGGRVEFAQDYFKAGDHLAVIVTGVNTIAGGPLDLYGGVVYPDGDTTLFFTPSGPRLARLSGPASAFVPLAPVGPGVTLSLSAPFGPGPPPLDLVPGVYTAFAGLVRPGTLADGTIDQDDIVDLVTAPVSFEWAPWPDEVLPILAKLPVVPGLHIHLDPYLCASAEDADCQLEDRTGLLSFYEENLAEIVLRSDWPAFGAWTSYEEIVELIAHEVCHAHQHRVVLDAGMEVGPDLDLASQWYRTNQGQAFFIAGGQASLPGHAHIDPYQDFANVCAFWYLRRPELQQLDPAMYRFASEWLPH